MSRTANVRVVGPLLALALAGCSSDPSTAPSGGGSGSSSSGGAGGASGSSGSSSSGGSTGAPIAGSSSSGGGRIDDGGPGSSGGGQGGNADATSPSGSGSSGGGSGGGDPARAGSSDGGGSDAGDAARAASSGGGSDGGDAASRGSSGGDASSVNGAPFACNLLVGPSPMYQWFNGGFLTYAGIDASRWELLMVAHHFTNVWAVPGDSAWNTPVTHPCSQNGATPDRIAFMATQWSENTAAQWEADFDGIIRNILAKWPTVKRIELMPSTSTPGDVPCPGAGAVPAASETIIPPYGYQAIDAMPAKYPGLVFSTPHFEVPACSDFIGNGAAPQYAPNATATTGPAVLDVAGVFGAYYAAHP